jgi:hypothetical protein
LFLFLGIGWILLCSILYSFLLSFFPLLSFTTLPSPIE